LNVCARQRKTNR